MTGLENAGYAAAATWEHAGVNSERVAWKQRLVSVRAEIDQLVLALRSIRISSPPANLTEEAAALMREHLRLLTSSMEGMTAANSRLIDLPFVLSQGLACPRVVAIAVEYVQLEQQCFSFATFEAWMRGASAKVDLLHDEIWLLPEALGFAVLEQLIHLAIEIFGSAATIPSTPAQTSALGAFVSTLKRLQAIEWASLLERYVPFENILREDPAGAYSKMDFTSRDRYRRRIVHLSKRSDMSEIEVARAVLRLALRHKSKDAAPERLQRRVAHVGYYLIGEGVGEVTAVINYHATWDERLRTLMYRHPDDFYIGPIVVFSILFIVVFIFPLVPNHSTLALLGIAIALLILPATQGAVDLVNTAITAILPAELLPKLDFSGGIPRDFTTLVAIPTLLLSEKQTRDLVHEIEVRYLANHDPNLLFALVTDLPDSLTRPVEEADARVQLAVSLINNLNDRYGGAGGNFFLLHRHRIFNKRQGVWMGWERKRGKLLDLNKLLKGEYDSFPVKAGNTALLSSVRFVITLDSDTKLPPGSAYRMAGTLAHPLNAGVIDPDLKIVTLGYAILQPRVGVSVRSATLSRMAAVYSGQSGYDVYTRAVSDAYQDLYGEGTFTGKGIYEVDTLHAVLDHRFPRNSLLSHDLIEGAYARVGLVTDVEVIDDFPSHYSAHNRRKHRWVRGDWQILQWLFSRVPDETGRLVNNPISTISRWKILDNLRRSLVEPVTFALLLAGWFVLPAGPLYWTLVTLGLLFLPALVQLTFSFGRALWSPSIRAFTGMLAPFGQTTLHALLILTFLPHQALLSIDAIIRSLVRSFVTGAHLLEWETAAEAESKSTRPSVVDNYLKATPYLAVGIALLLAWDNSRALLIASPILILWAFETALVRWLNGSPRELHFSPDKQQEIFLRKLALRTWRFFADYSNEQHTWLIPDNFEEGWTKQAARVSPTNLGLLLNARQAALQLGYLTLPEVLALTLETLDSVDRLETYKGHIYNWYSTETLAPLPPRVVSSVDSGNFAASLYTLSSGLRSSADNPVFSNRVLQGLSDHLHILDELKSIPASWQALAQHLWGANAEKDDPPSPEVISLLFEAELHHHGDAALSLSSSDEIVYWQRQTKYRIERACSLLREFTPWLLPQFKGAVETFVATRSRPEPAPALSDDPTYIADLLPYLRNDTAGGDSSDKPSKRGLVGRLESAKELTSDLLEKIADTAERAFRMAHQMDFQFLVDSQRGLLKIGFERGGPTPDSPDGKLYDACYDLLASEARIATFLAVAKGDIQQESWFKMGRTHVEAYGQVSLISWTGTMFEYLMPAIWMRSYPETMMARSLSAAVHAHRAYAAGSGGIPWGVSECGHAGRDDMGNYGYHAFGVPQLALKWDATAGPVISPYSTCLALAAQPVEAIANLQRMAKMGWVGAYGFYEAADYTMNRAQPELVKEWMAHHQGMSLVALTNVLEKNIFQNWFHANAHIEAAELILHERPLSYDAVATRSNSSNKAVDLENAVANGTNS